jgi:lactoylglutathione lyase
MNPSAFIKGIFETHLNVRNLERSMDFYAQVVGLEPGIHDAGRRLAIFWVGGRGRAFLGLWETPEAQIIKQHFAFELDFADLEPAIKSLSDRNIEVLDFFDTRTDVPTVFGWIPAASVYFDDPDGHLLELLAKLPGPARPDIGIVSLPEWNQRNGDHHAGA